MGLATSPVLLRRYANQVATEVFEGTILDSSVGNVYDKGIVLHGLGTGDE